MKIDAKVRVLHFRSLEHIRKAHLKPREQARDETRGVWIWGESGIGKSSKARHDFPHAYPKMVNKWWDGYQGQKNVIMDDIDPKSGQYLGMQLKHWGDRFDCILESKGGALLSDYDNFIVTS